MANARPTVAVIGTRGYPSYYGGFETAVRHLVPYLVRVGWHVRVYGRETSATQEPLPPHVEVVTTRGIDTTKLSTLSFGFTAALHTLRKKPDVALIMNVANGYWLPLLRLRGIPTLVNVDGIEWERAKWSGLGKAVFKLGARLTARFATQLVFDAEAIGDYWRREFSRGGLFIPYGAEESAPLDTPLGLSTHDFVLLVARFVPENSVREFIEAASEISKQHDVVLVGSAPEGSELHELAHKASESNSRIKWLGHLSDDSLLYALWQHAGVYFHGHSVGGTNPALVQAMALGAHIVARDTVYNREVLRDAATFCSPDPGEIARAILTEIGSPLSQDRRMRALDRTRSVYNWPRVCGQYHLALNALLVPRPTNRASSR